MENSLDIRIEAGDSRTQVRAWTIEGLRKELQRFEQDLRANGYADNSVHTYVDRSDRFLNWLVGEFRVQDQRD